MSPLRDLPLIIKWHLIRKNSALYNPMKTENSQELQCSLLKRKCQELNQRI
eukprot:UN21339